MTPLLNPPQRRFLRSLFLFLVTVLNIPLHAAVRESWVQRFDGGFPNKASQPVAMQLDSQGNIYVVGSNANASNLTDYVTLKYAYNGTLLWSKHYGSTNGLNNTPRAMAVDTNNSVYITGTSVTVKYSESGEELWAAAYAGKSLVTQGTNVYVTGFSDTQFVTAALTSDGSDKWVRHYQGALGGPDFSLSVFSEGPGSILVVGRETFRKDRVGNYQKSTLVKYDQNGTELLATNIAYGTGSYPNPGNPLNGLRTAIQGSAGRLYLIGDDINATFIDKPNDGPFGVLARGSNGSWLWDLRGWVYGGDHIAAAVESGNHVYAGGASAGAFFMMAISSEGLFGWAATFPGILADGTKAGALPGLVESISSDEAHQPCVTGFMGGLPSGLSVDIATAKYATNGTLLWTQQYNGEANGRDEGKAIVTDSSGNVYVAGLSTTPEGGTEIVLLKYSEYTTVEQSPTGTILLQFPGTPGQPYKIQASTNLPNWLDIGLGTATTNGLLQFEDTNATQHPFRFYQTVIPVQ